MDSLQWVDQTYTEKHKSEDPSTLRPMYHSNLLMYPAHGDISKPRRPKEAVRAFLIRYGRRAAISLLVYILSFTPVVGRFVLPAASFYTLNKTLGPLPASLIFGSGIFLPKRYLILFLQSFFASRSLMRELVRVFFFFFFSEQSLQRLIPLKPYQLEPYFSRIRFTKDQKKRWFRDREGLLFGFGVGFYIFLKIPLLGVLIYGIAEASTAYLVTKITDPPPPPPPSTTTTTNASDTFAESQTQWTNKHEFLRLPLANLDLHHLSSTRNEEQDVLGAARFQGKKFS